MQESTNNNTGKGKMPINTKILVAILAVLVVGIGAVLAAPSIREAKQQADRKAAVEELFGKQQPAAKPAPSQIEMQGGTAWGNKASRGQ